MDAQEFRKCQACTSVSPLHPAEGPSDSLSDGQNEITCVGDSGEGLSYRVVPRLPWQLA